MSLIPNEYQKGYDDAFSDLARELKLVERPWGTWRVIEQGPYYKVKELIIHPKQSISNQYHNHRSETWCITSGFGQLFLNSRIKVVQKGDVFTIDPCEWHKVCNLSEKENFVAIEVQMGEICEESDIVRE